MAKAKKKQAASKDKAVGKKAAAKKAEGSKGGGKKKASAEVPAVEEAGADVKPEVAKKGGGKKKAAAEKAAKKSGGGKKAAADDKAGGKKKAATEKAAKKSGGGKKTAATEKAAKKGGGKKKAAAAEKSGGKKKAAAEKTGKKPGGKKKAADEKSGGKKKAAAEKTGKKPGGKKKAASKKAKGNKKGKAKGATLAETSDRHVLYQLSVQSPEADIEFFADRYRELRGREPKVLREDFCGTAFISATWAASADDRRAVGVDLDEATLEWGREHNLARISEDARSRVDLRQENVLDGGGEKADLTCAMNFSYGVFKTRAELRRYLEVAHASLADDGVFITELYGGVEAVIEVVDEREIEGSEGVDDFVYVWEQASYNPINHETLCHIHFRLKDGSTIDNAFTYDWRLWTIPELRELLYEAGFSSVRVFWEATDASGDGTGEYVPTEKEDNQESWLVYIVAAK
ncbi:MAG: class I SAM-dependent methyltransferase [Myxococcales bacterium]|nr:class I SAM-dependent methyltransferase [Myxococcales bacterium]